MSNREPDLAAGELEVLQALWQESPVTVREVLNLLHERGRKVAYTTVLTVLTRLEQKGYVQSDKSGVAYVYRPMVSQEKVSKNRLQAVLDLFYDGAAGPLVLQLMREQRLTTDEIAELQKLIHALDAEPPADPRRGRGRARAR